MPVPRGPQQHQARAERERQASSEHGTVLSLTSDVWAGTLPAPDVLGVKSDVFRKWRPGQEAAIMTSLSAEERCVIECLPTGAGKTAIYLAEAVMNGGKVVILTSTKAQQDQITESVRPLIEAGVVVDVRGQQNYRCEAVQPGGEFEHLNPRNEWWSVAEGPCMDGATCPLKDGGCHYFDQIRKAKRSQIVVTNYAFWMTNKDMEPRWQITDGRPVDLLICDEAHEAVEEVCKFLAVEIEKSDERLITSALGIRLPSLNTAEVAAWQDWARLVYTRIDVKLEMREENSPRQRKELRKLQRKMEKMIRMSDDGNWVVQSFDAGDILIRFDPIWPKSLAEDLLFREAKKILMSSATVRKKTGRLLGLEEEDINIFESASSFDPSRRPTYHIPCIQMNWRTEQTEKGVRAWTEMTARIMQERLDRNGLIHTTSYKRRDVWLRQAQERWPYLYKSTITHTRSSLDVRRAISQLSSNLSRLRSGAQYKSTSGLYLASPSVTTGYDFKYGLAEVGIMPKLPIPDTRSKVMKARVKSDPEYGPYITATTVMQATGRLMRADDDQGEMFIIDDTIRRFLGQWGYLMTQWWMEAFRFWGDTMEWKRGQLPEAPVALGRVA